jgi:hypothetical protein
MQPSAHDGTYTLKLFVRQGGTDYVVETWDETDFPFNVQVDKDTVLTVSPDDSAAWEDADVDALEVGVIFTAYSEGASNTVVRLYQMYATVNGVKSGTANAKILITDSDFSALSEDLATWSDISGATTTPTQPELRRWDWTEFADKLYFTNGSDDIYFYPNAGPVMDELTTKPVGRCITTFVSRIVQGDVIESGTRNDDQVRWCVVDDATDWAGAGSGNMDLDNTPGRIVGLKPLVEFGTSYVGVLVAYKSQGIYHITPTGNAGDPFDQRLMNGSVGLHAVNSLIGYVSQGKEVHAFLGHENEKINVFEWDGAQATPIGDPVKDDIAGEINWTHVGNAFAGFDHEGGNYVLAIATGSKTFPQKAWVFNAEKRQWTTWPLPEISCMGVWKINKRWQQVVGKADALAYEFSTSQTSDEGSVAIPQTLTTGDFQLNGPQGRSIIYRVWLFYHDRGAATVTSDISTDGGGSYGTAVSTSLATDNDGAINVALVDHIAEGRMHRIRLQCDAAGEELDLIKMIVEWEPQDTAP